MHDGLFHTVGTAVSLYSYRALVLRQGTLDNVWKQDCFSLLGQSKEVLVGMLLNTFQYTEQPPATKNYPALNNNSSEVATLCYKEAAVTTRVDPKP